MTSERSGEDALSPDHQLVQAVERVYRALHLPRPGVIDHIVAVTRRDGYEWLYGLTALALPLASLAIMGQPWRRMILAGCGSSSSASCRSSR